MSLRILLVDDHGIIRAGLRSLLNKQQDMEVVAEAEDGRQAIDFVHEFTPDIVIMDISMPTLNGVDAAREIVSQHPKTRIIALSIHSNKRFVGNMLKAGASGYILKECLFDELIEAIQTVTEGSFYLSPRITGVVIEDYVTQLATNTKPQTPVLTPRQRQVLQLLAEGRSTKQIALKLFVSAKAIEANRRQIMEKLNIYSVAELTKYAVREGLTSLE